jgi:hypothetical protein
MTKTKGLNRVYFYKKQGVKQKMDRFQKNTIKSFRRVKEDMRNLQAQITEVMRTQEELVEKLEGNEQGHKRTGLKRVTRKVVRKRA